MSDEIKHENLDLETLRFLATKSEYVINAQLESQRAKESNAGIIIGVISLFVPIFIVLLDKTKIIVILSAFPFSGLLFSLILFLKVLSTPPIMRAIRPEKFEEMASMKIQEVLLKEIGANFTAYKENMLTYRKVNDIYNCGIKNTILSIIISVITLVLSKFTV